MVIFLSPLVANVKRFELSSFMKFVTLSQLNHQLNETSFYFIEDNRQQENKKKQS